MTKGGSFAPSAGREARSGRREAVGGKRQAPAASRFALPALRFPLRACRLTLCALRFSLRAYVGRVAAGDRFGGNIFHHDAPGADDGPGANLHSRPDKGLRSNPTAGAHLNRFGDQREIGPVPVVRARAQERALGDADVGLDDNRRQTDDEDLFAQPDMVADANAPGERNVDPGAYHDAQAYARAEEPQQPDPEARWQRPGRHKEN